MLKQILIALGSESSKFETSLILTFLPAILILFANKYLDDVLSKKFILVFEKQEISISLTIIIKNIQSHYYSLS